MENRKVRVRFAPSPTGPLHIGGVRTALYNFLFAKKHGGDFILRIEDTDQNRFVPGAEQYIIEALKWCGIEPNEGVGFGDGNFAQYRQSERKEVYKKYAVQLLQSGNAYYAFDTSEELEEARLSMEKTGSSFSYNANTRKSMKNSLSLPEEEVNKKISKGEKYVIRIKIPQNEEVRLRDLIREEVIVHTSQMDDKVLFKSDGMPTYHLANVVDDYLMKITHVIRGEEWLPSAPLHVLLYRFLGWENRMPEFAHLPLLLKPDGNGKLSKRDGDRLGFPVFPLQWTDPKTGEISSGYREKGYFPDAFINMLALLGWNPGTEQEIFSLEELAQIFSFENVHKSGARFNPEKAKWFNQQYLKKKTDDELAKLFMEDERWKTEDEKKDFGYIKKVCGLIKEKAYFVNEFRNLADYFFVAPTTYDEEIIRKKWNEKSPEFFKLLIGIFQKNSAFSKEEIDSAIKQATAQLGIKQGEVMQLLRVLITGKNSGADLPATIELLGKNETLARLNAALHKLKSS